MKKILLFLLIAFTVNCYSQSVVQDEVHLSEYIKNALLNRGVQCSQVTDVQPFVCTGNYSTESNPGTFFTSFSLRSTNSGLFETSQSSPIPQDKQTVFFGELSISVIPLEDDILPNGIHGYSGVGFFDNENDTNLLSYLSSYKRIHGQSLDIRCAKFNNSLFQNVWFAGDTGNGVNLAISVYFVGYKATIIP